MCTTVYAGSTTKYRRVRTNVWPGNGEKKEKEKRKEKEKSKLQPPGAVRDTQVADTDTTATPPPPTAKPTAVEPPPVQLNRTVVVDEGSSKDLAWELEQMTLQRDALAKVNISSFSNSLSTSPTINHQPSLTVKEKDVCEVRAIYPTPQDVIIQSYTKVNGTVTMNFKGGSPYSPIRMTSRSSDISTTKQFLMDSGCHLPISVKR